MTKTTYNYVLFGASSLTVVIIYSKWSKLYVILLGFLYPSKLYKIYSANNLQIILIITITSCLNTPQEMQL